jgi:hypothetical protein
MAEKENSRKTVLDWLLEPADSDPGSAGVRYLALCDLVKVEGAELAAAKKGPMLPALLLKSSLKWIRRASG